MKPANLILHILMATALSMGQSTFAADQPVEVAPTEATEKTQAQVQAEYQRALTEANRSRSKAQSAVAEARTELEKASREQSESRREFSAERRAEIEAMREKLNQARRDLRESSRELSEVNRELMIVTQSGAERQIIISGAGNPVIGAALGDKTGAGVAVLGVSPNGPAERAGLQAGDVIVAVDGVALSSVGNSSVDNSGDARDDLNTILSNLEAFEPLILSVERGADSLDLMVVPEVLKPLSWQTVVRFPSAPAAPHAPVSASAAIASPTAAPSVAVAPSQPGAPPAVAAPAENSKNLRLERILVQELDREALAEQITRMEMEIEQRGGHTSGAHPISGDDDSYEYYFSDMSELGNIALSDTNAWYGMPLTSGLRLAQIDPDLGEYFDTERGVLVLKAKPGNALSLQTGDVVLALIGTEVNSPEDFMRALRKLIPGEAVQIEIKRKRKNQTLNPVISDEQAQLFTPQDFQDHQVIVSDNGQGADIDIQAKFK